MLEDKRRFELAQAVLDLEQAIQSAAFDDLRENGDYPSAETLLSIARDIRSIGRRLELGWGNGAEKAPAAASTKPRQRGRRPEYPRYIVTTDRIIKIGKGKSATAEEYRHEAPREALDRFVSWLDGLSAAGVREWQGQEAVDALAGEVPSYQTYLVISVLRAAGLILPTRRGSYQVATPTMPTADYWGSIRAEFGGEEIGAANG